MANMGAPLGIEDSIWVSGAADDVANDRPNHRKEVDEPFLADLDLGQDRPSGSGVQIERGSSM